MRTAVNHAVCTTEMACIELSVHLPTACSFSSLGVRQNPTITPEVNLDYNRLSHRTPFVIKIGGLSLGKIDTSVLTIQLNWHLKVLF